MIKGDGGRAPQRFLIKGHAYIRAAPLASTTGQHHWPGPVAGTIDTTGQQHWPSPFVSTTGRHHWPDPWQHVHTR